MMHIVVSNPEHQYQTGLAAPSVRNAAALIVVSSIATGCTVGGSVVVEYSAFVETC